MQLRKYQRKLVDEFIQDKRKCFLCAEMRLGKSAIAITVTEEIKSKLCIILCPASLCYNWLAECKKWVSDWHSVSLKVDNLTLSSKHTKYLIISYSRLAKRLNGLSYLIKETKSATLICDESHYLKNLGTKSKPIKRTQSVLSLSRMLNPTDRVLMLTATPMPNRPLELYSQIQIADPTILNSYSTYSDYVYHFCAAKYKKLAGKKIFDASGSSNLEELGQILLPYMSMLKKSDVLDQLPKQIIEHVVLPPFKSKDSVSFPEKISSLEDLQSLEKSEHISTLRKELGLHKAKCAVDHIENLLLTTKKLVIFAHHLSVISFLKTRLKEYKPVILDGSVAVSTRHNIINAFQELPETRIFIGQIKTAGVGIALHAADTAIFIEVDWSPGNNDQAAQRIYRVGQESPTYIQYMVTNSYLDDKITKLVTKKQTIIRKFEMSVKNKKISTHALLSPSSAHRWMECPASINASKDVAQKDSASAKEGTEAHLYCEKVLQEQITLCDMPVKFRRHVGLYVAYIKKEAKNADLFLLEESLHIENKLFKNNYGTADCIIIKNKQLQVIDFKYGKNIYVCAVNNKQLLNYAVLAYLKFGYEQSYAIEEIKLTIIQPRCGVDNFIRHEILTLDQLLSFAKDLKTAINNVEVKSDTFVSGDHCQFCPHKPDCAEYSKL
jgi:SWI/SNF-related matrix-associated actin-dependent regulator 1 of chromatin subfamily A